MRCSPTRVRTANPMRACGTMGISTPVRSPSVAARARCNATSWPSACWGCRVTSEATALSPTLLAWLTSDDHDVDGWADDLPIQALRCHPDLGQRLTEISRPVDGVCRA